MRYAIALFTAVAAFFVSVGVSQVLTQQQALANARPVPGRVFRKPELRVVESTDAKNRKTVTYRPEVWYRYELGGSICTGQTVLPMTRTTSKRRGEEIVAQFPEGKPVIVWYVPDAMGNPKASFLVREWDFAPYLTILYCMIPLAAGLGVWVGRPWQRAKVMPPRPPQQGGSWRQLEIRVGQRARRHPWRAVTLVWFVLGGVAIGHYFIKADRPFGLDALIVSPIYLALGVIPLAMFLRHVRAARAAEDARVFVNTDAFVRGKTFDVRVEQRFKRPAHVESLRIGLVCEQTAAVAGKKRSVLQTSLQGWSWNDVKSDDGVTPGRPLEGRTKLTPPADQPASTAEGAPPPSYRWWVAVEVKVRERADYRAEFPIAVED
jgi:hypothetical protein